MFWGENLSHHIFLDSINPILGEGGSFWGTRGCKGSKGSGANLEGELPVFTLPP